MQPMPTNYSLSARISGEGDDWTDIEMRSATEKYTVATVEDRFANLFLAAPDLLAAAEYYTRTGFDPETGFKMLKAAIIKAKGEWK